MKVFLGIDGGGTKTAVCALNAQREPVFTWSGPGSSIDTYPMAHVTTVLYDALHALPQDYDVVAVFAGLGGVISKTHQTDISQLLRDHPRLHNAKIEVDNDVRNALAGSLGTTEGVVLIVGTGSVAYGYRHSHSWRSGGYSHLEGDPGSAYDLGLSALRYAARTLDGRLKTSSFSRAILQHLGVTQFDQLAAVFNRYSRGEIAALAHLVTQHAHTPIAQRMLKKGARECARMVHAVISQLGDDSLVLGLVGGAVLKSALYQQLICEAIHHFHPHLKIIKQPVMSPDQGAALIAWQGIYHD